MGQRAERFAHLIAQELNTILARGDIKDPRVSDAGFITITHVGVTDDLGLARVKVVLHGADEEKSKELIKGLSSARNWLHNELGRRLSSKKTPELRFEIDTTDDRADRVEELLKEIADENAKRA